MTRATTSNITDPATMALDVEISPGLRVRDLQTRADCARATALLQQDVNNVVGQLHRAERLRIEVGTPVDVRWRHKAQGAISRMRAKIKAINIHAGTLPRKPKAHGAADAIINTIREEIGEEELRRYVELAKQRRPEAFEKQEQS